MTFRSTHKKRLIQAALADFSLRQRARVKERQEYAGYVAGGDLPVYRQIKRKEVESTFETPRSHGVQGRFRKAE
jgi:hypothetical protein